MSMSGVTSQRDEIESQAADWILRRDRGELAPAERQALEAWLSADSRHREAYLKLFELWRLAGGLKAWNPVNGQFDADPFAPVSKRSERWRSLSLAAAVLIAVCGALFWQAYTPGQTYETAIGGYQRVSLSDGSILQLNTDSKVQVKVGDRSRVVRLLRGEAYFEVAHDRQRPFDVIAGNKVVRAVGTAFSVYLRDPQRVDVLVAEGRVSVREEGTSSAESIDGFRQELLKAGELGVTQPGGIRIAEVAPADVARQLGWQSGVLHFKNQPLAEVVAEFNRYNVRKLAIADEQLAELEVGGSFRTGDLESFIAALRGVRGIRVDEREGTILLSSIAP
jgi:transmembrane sensor